MANAFVKASALDVPDETFQLDLDFCRTCGLVQIKDTVPPNRMFVEYPYFSSQSQAFVEHAHRLVARVLDEYDFSNGSLAMEIASNDGYLLQHYHYAGIPVLGIDPARNVAREAERRGIPTLCEFFDLGLADRLRTEGVRAKVIHANNVLAHVPAIQNFVQGLHRVLDEEGVLIIETPYVRDLVENLEFDTIYHEHVFYYSLTALRNLFERYSLAVVNIERLPVHGGSLRVFIQRDGISGVASSVDVLQREEEELGIGSVDYYSSFARRVTEARAELAAFLRRLHDDGSRLAGYGAAAKGTMLLNSLRLDQGTIEYIVDSTPYKQGRLMPGVKVPIFSPERLSAHPPDYVIVLAWNVAEEIIAQEDAYVAQGGRFIIPLPSPRVVTTPSEVAH